MADLADLQLVMRDFCGQLNNWLQEHDDECHYGERCEAERANALAYIGHRLGCNEETLTLFLMRLQDYDAIHDEHHVSDAD